MAEFGSGRKNRIPVSKDDIKKAIKSANDRLKKANEKLNQDIADKKKSLASVGKEVDSSNKELESVLAAIKSNKNDTFKTKSEASKERAKLSKLKKQVDEAVENEDRAQSSLNNLTKESNILDKKVAKMNDDLAIASTVKEEIKLLKSDKKIRSKELEQILSESDDVKKELSKLRADSIEKKEVHKELLTKLDAEVEAKQKALDAVDGEYVIKIAELNTKISGLKDHINEKEQEAGVIESLLNKRELDYIEMESKYKQAENALMYAQELTGKEIERENSEKQKIKDNFKRWKISALEEVARLILKKKIENIDRAGLAEILDG